MTVYAACLSFAQGGGAPTVTGTMLVSEEGRRTTISAQWKLPHAIEAEGNPAEWLYSVLSRVVADFDDHVVTGADIDGSSAMVVDAS